MPLKLIRRPDSSIWYVRGTVRGRRIFETTETDRKDLAELFRAKREAELYEESVFGKRAVVSFQRAALSYLEFDAHSTGTIKTVGRLVAHFGAVKLALIDQAAADRAVASILTPTAAPASKARSVYTPLTAILMHAHKRGWCDRPHFDRPEPPKGKTRWLTPVETIRLIEGAAAHLRPLLVFFLCTGARVAEALDLDWADVDLAAAKVMLRDTKNGRDRPAMLPPAALIALANLPSRKQPDGSLAKAGPVFLRDDGEPYADRGREEGGQIRTAFATACRRAGLITWIREEGLAAGSVAEKADGPCSPISWAPTVTPHDLRHTWATYFYALTKDFMLLKDEGGWRSLAMVERYAHLMPSELVPAIASLWGASHPRIGTLPSLDGAYLAQVKR